VGLASRFTYNNRKAHVLHLHDATSVCGYLFTLNGAQAIINFVVRPSLFGWLRLSIDSSAPLKGLITYPQRWVVIVNNSWHANN